MQLAVAATDAPRSGRSDATESDDFTETVIARQLEIMEQQLEVLRRGRSPSDESSSRSAAASESAPPAHDASGSTSAGSAGTGTSRPTPSRVSRAEVSSGQGNARLGPWKPVDKGPGGALTPRQQEHLNALITRLNERTPGSKRWTQSHRARLADPRTVMGFRLPWKELVYPIVVTRSLGSRVWDVDGNEYVDLTTGFGSCMLGHSPPFVIEAVEEQLKKGVEIGPQTPLAGEVANLFCELTAMERVAFCNTGSEAVLAAIRVARTVTGRSRIVTFSGDYHGIFDEVLGRGVTVGGKRRTIPVAPGIPRRMVEDVLILDYGAPESLDAIREHAGDIAAVIVEPVQSRRPELQPREFLHALRELTQREDIPLVFDEMITGFRIHPGGAQAWFDVKADIATYGKAVAGGFPIGVVAGRSRYLDALDGGMWSYGDDTVPEVGVTWFAGTFVRHPVAMAAAGAALRHMKERGPALQKELNARTERFVHQLNSHFARVGAPLHVQHFSSFFLVTFESHQEFQSVFFFHLRDQGVHILEGRAAFLSTAHTDEDVELLVRAFKEAVRRMQEGGFFPDTDPPPTSGRPAEPADTIAVDGVPAPDLGRPIPSESVDTVRALCPTESQKEILRTSRLGDDASCAYNLTHSLELEGALDVDAMRRALEQLVARHDSFRLVFPNGSESMQVIPAVGAPLPVDDLAELREEARETRFQEILKTATSSPLDLRAGPCFRARLVRLSETRHVLLLTLHHVMCDGFSGRTVLQDLSSLYEAACRNVDAGLPAPMQYTEYARWQEDQRSTGEHAAAREYWIRQYSPPPAFLELPTDRPRPPIKTYACGEEVARIPREQLEALRRLGAKEGCTLFSVLLAGLSVVLNRLTGQVDVVVGAPASGQSVVGAKDLVGHCVQMHPFRSTVSRERTLGEYLSSVQDRVFENYEHRNHTFGALLREIGYPDDPSRPPLISVQFNLEPRVTPLEFHRLEVKRSFHRDFHSVDLAFNLAEHDDGMHVKCWFNRDLFDAQTARGWLHGYLGLLADLESQLTQKIGELSLALAPSADSAAETDSELDAALDSGSGVLNTTDAQKEIWLASQLSPEASCVFNLSYTFRLNGRLDLDALRKAVHILIGRHEALRARITPDGRRMEFEHALKIELPCRDLSSLEETRREDELSAVITRDMETPFDLARGPLVRGQIVKMQEDHHELILTFQHIVCDGLAFRVIARELGAIYTGVRRGEDDGLESAARFGDYVQRQERGKKGSRFSASRRFWLEQYAEPPLALDLPVDTTRPSGMIHRNRCEYLEVDLETLKAIKSFAVGNNSTLFGFTLAAYQCLLERLTGQRDVVVGLFAVEQSLEESNRLVGHCVNLLPLRAEVDPERPFSEFLRRSRETVLAVYDHQDFTYGALLEQLSIARGTSQAPLVSTGFSFERAFDDPGFDGLTTEIRNNVKRFTNLDLELYLTESTEGLKLRCHYNADIFQSETVVRWMTLYRNLLLEIISCPDTRIGELRLLDERTRERVLVDWNATEEEYPRDETIHALIERQAELHADRVAAVFPAGRTRETTGELTYGELDRRANQLAAHLVRRGIGSGDLVGLYLDRSEEMLVGLLGVLKSGATYVPLDPMFPRERIRLMLEDSGVHLVLSHARLVETLPESGFQVVALDAEWEQIAGEPTTRSGTEIASDSLAYVIYTSGSTGRPKGVQISHRAVVNFLTTMAREPGFKDGDVLLSTTTLSFDIAVLELFLPLLTGGRVVVASRDDGLDGHRIAQLLEGYDVSVMQATPATWRLLLESGWSGRPSLKILCGGEALPEELAGRLLESGAELWNMYGPTETTVWSTTKKIDSLDGPVTIGRPIGNTQVYIVDAHLNPVPVGVAGELLIGGDGLARGYFNRPDITSERFLPDPFSGKAGARLYRTGDLARFRPDGEIVLLGRIDHQVKIRGFRIELGEIEVALTRHDEVEQAVVIAREERPGDRVLVAYYTTPEGSDIPTSELRDALQDQLPDYMLPSSFVHLESLPLTPNGKIDRLRLPAPGRDHGANGAYVAPRDSLELQLIKLWEKTLDRSPIGVTDDFFLIGGHSLLAAQLFSKINEVLDVNLPLAMLFEASTVEQLADRLRKKDWSPSWRSLAPIQAGGSKPPFYCVHGAGGNVLLYRDLARHLGPDQPVYGLVARGLDGKEPFLTRLEDMAAHYVDEIKSIQPDGPYYLGGYCLGGTIAYEMAQQLQARGDEVGLVVFFETYNIKATEASSSLRRVLNVWQNVGFHFSNLRLLEKGGRATFLQEKAKVARRRLKRHILSPFARAARKLNLVKNGNGLPYVNLTKVNDQAQLDYEPRPYTGRVTLFRPNGTFSGYADPDFGWRHLVSDFETHVLPVYPRGMLVEPFVATMAEKLRQCLDDAQAGRSVESSDVPVDAIL